jgi:heat shock protein HtpX
MDNKEEWTRNGRKRTAPQWTISFFGPRPFPVHFGPFLVHFSPLLFAGLLTKAAIYDVIALMQFVKRIFLFLVINALVVVTLSIILNLLNVRPYLNAHGLDYKSLMIFCIVWGMGGALISLALSRKMAKWLMSVRLIDPKDADADERRLLHIVAKLAKEADLAAMPQVGIYESKEVNAFATGPSQRRSLVAVSRGLIERMSNDEIEGVLAHEITHIANGDMVTMTLLQGIINAFVMFLARILAFVVSGLGKSRESSSSSGSYASYMMFVFLFEMVFMVLGMLVLAGYSRFREFRADAGGAKLAGKQKMINALESLRANQRHHSTLAEKPAIQSFKISNRPKHGLLALFSTHPPLEERIKRLEEI